MATKLNKKVSRVSMNDTLRDKSKYRPLIVTIYPGTPDTGGLLGLRMQGTRSEEFISLDSCFHRAIRNRVALAKMEKGKAKALKKKRGY